MVLNDYEGDCMTHCLDSEDSTKLAPVKEKWRLIMFIKFGVSNESTRWMEGKRLFNTREEAEFAMLTAERTMKNCGFEIRFSLDQESSNV
jgi:hypothetical protein